MQQATVDDNNTYADIETIIQNESESDALLITTTQEQQSQQSAFLMSAFHVPPELQIPLIVLIALLGFVVILVLSSVSVVPKSKQAVTNSKKDDDTNAAVLDTPTRKSTRSSSEVTGLIETPAGRRSARLRAKQT